MELWAYYVLFVVIIVICYYINRLIFYKKEYKRLANESEKCKNVLIKLRHNTKKSIESSKHISEKGNLLSCFQGPPLKYVNGWGGKIEEATSLELEVELLESNMNDFLDNIFQRFASVEKERADARLAYAQLQAITENELSEVQRSYICMENSIQKKYDSFTDKLPERITYIASLMADYLTLRIKENEEFLHKSDKYHERQRAVKISEIRAETKELLSKYKEAQYQLDYLIRMYPELSDVIECGIDNCLSFDDMQSNKEEFEGDPVSKYLSREEWNKLTETERNQLALDRYLERMKSNWEIGRDYELYIAHVYESEGYDVDTFGSYMRLNDLGRDLIAKKGRKTLVIQCKYWSAKKEIHENHICQLFGTTICYCLENKLSYDDVEPVFVTSTVLSDKAKEFANMLHIKVVQDKPLRDFPRIKCNIGHDEYGFTTKIYHLPMDQLYDKTKITKNGECYCYTVAEAESKGFRRAFKWHGY